MLRVVCLISPSEDELKRVSWELLVWIGSTSRAVSEVLWWLRSLRRAFDELASQMAMLRSAEPDMRRLISGEARG